MYAIVYMFSHQFQVPFFITDYLSVLVPYIFTSFSNTSGYCNCRICVSVPYIFTSFSNMPERIVSAEDKYFSKNQSFKLKGAEDDER